MLELEEQECMLGDDILHFIDDPKLQLNPVRAREKEGSIFSGYNYLGEFDD